ncbi:hypothetical protein CB1_000385002 [Camelus ferus]|nr:hypothetical protein CB1_000385002 [Camelus ferus]
MLFRKNASMACLGVVLVGGFGIAVLQGPPEGGRKGSLSLPGSPGLCLDRPLEPLLWAQPCAAPQPGVGGSDPADPGATAHCCVPAPGPAGLPYSSSRCPQGVSPPTLAMGICPAWLQLTGGGAAFAPPEADGRDPCHSSAARWLREGTGRDVVAAAGPVPLQPASLVPWMPWVVVLAVEKRWPRRRLCEEPDEKRVL